MTNQVWLIAYGATLVVFLVLDFAWLSTVGAACYKPALVYHMTDTVRFGVAFCFYLIIAAAIVFFSVRPALEGHNGLTALCYGAFFGFAAYATYDLSNLSTLKLFPVNIAVLDMAWGTVLASVSAYAGFRAASAWG